MYEVYNASGDLVYTISSDGSAQLISFNDNDISMFKSIKKNSQDINDKSDLLENIASSNAGIEENTSYIKNISVSSNALNNNLLSKINDNTYNISVGFLLLFGLYLIMHELRWWK